MAIVRTGRSAGPGATTGRGNDENTEGKALSLHTTPSDTWRRVRVRDDRAVSRQHRTRSRAGYHDLLRRAHPPANARFCLAGETNRVVAPFTSAVQVTATPTLAINVGAMENPATFDSVQL